MQKLEYEPFHTEPVQDYIRDNREYINNKDSSFSYILGSLISVSMFFIQISQFF